MAELLYGDYQTVSFHKKLSSTFSEVLRKNFKYFTVGIVPITGRETEFIERKRFLFTNRQLHQSGRTEKLQVVAGRLDIEKFCKNMCQVCDVKMLGIEATIDPEISKVSCSIEN